MTRNDPTSPKASGLSRRQLLRGGAAGGVGLVLAGSLDLLSGGPVSEKDGEQAGYGALVTDRDGLLSLPAGFTYAVVAESGVTRLESGEPTPSEPDGSAAFPARGGAGSVLVVNHEIAEDEPHKVPALEGLTYNPAAGGGTTTIEVDAQGRRVREYVSLAGTMNNCAGGRTPWSTWLSCEEYEGVVEGMRHGYVFEVDPYDRDANRDPRPIKALGRFAHESVSVDPDSGTLYMTEDAVAPNGLLYRFLPPPDALPLRRGSLKALAYDAGTLEALRATTKDGAHVPDLSVAVEPGTTYRVGWVPVPDRDAAEASVREQFEPGLVTRSRKLEGMWWGDGGTYFVASFARADDGSAVQHDGQVWFLDARARTIDLKLRFAYTPEDQSGKAPEGERTVPDGNPDGPDNITVSPWGGVIVAEDGEGASHLVGATPGGRTFFLARNELDGGAEFAGPTFSEDRRTLFANLQVPGHVFAIRGPFVRQE
jgi:secreted PhoX family phosphatase